MGFERRGNNTYYYKKEREGGRVVSRYVGSGETASLIHTLNQWEKAEKEDEKQRRNKERRREADLDAEIDSLFGLTGVFTDALFLTHGYHQHKRQWRKKRNGKEKR
jgi:hypothetical protein